MCMILKRESRDDIQGPITGIPFSLAHISDVEVSAVSRDQMLLWPAFSLAAERRFGDGKEASIQSKTFSQSFCQPFRKTSAQEIKFPSLCSDDQKAPCVVKQENKINYRRKVGSQHKWQIHFWACLPPCFGLENPKCFLAVSNPGSSK